MINFKYIKYRDEYFDVTLVPVKKKLKTISENAKRIKANKFLLSAASDYFATIFKFGEEAKQEEIQIEVPDVNMFEKIVNSIYEKNVSQLLLDLPSVEKKILMIHMCTQFLLNIDYDDLLQNIDVDSSSLVAFVDLLLAIGKPVEEYGFHMIKNIKDSSDLLPLKGVISNVIYNNLVSYIELKFVVCDNEGGYVVYNAHDGTEFLSSEEEENKEVLGFYGNSLLLLDSHVGKITTFNIKSKKETLKMKVGRSPYNITASLDCKYVAIISKGKITIFNLKSKTNIVIYAKEITKTNDPSSFTIDNSKFIILSSSGYVFVWDTMTGDLSSKFEVPMGDLFPHNVVPIPETKQIIVLFRTTRKFTVWNFETKELVYESDEAKTFINYISVSPDGEEIATNHNGGMVCIWRDGHIIHTLTDAEGGYEPGENIIYSPFGDEIISFYGFRDYLSIRNKDGDVLRNIKIDDFRDLFYSQ